MIRAARPRLAEQVRRSERLPVERRRPGGLLDPKASQAVKKLMGIDEDYYIAVPPDPTEKEMEGIWATLRGLRQVAPGTE